MVPTVPWSPRYSLGNDQSKQLAAATRLAIIDALQSAGGGHYGGALSVVEILHALHRNRVVWSGDSLGDRLILSKGHAAIAHYAVLKTLGTDIDLDRYGEYGAGLEGHPDMITAPCLSHFSTGSLGQGLAVGLGMALALRDTGQHVWVVLGDGECQEGQIWETAMLAARLYATDLHAIVDLNGAQECGWRHDTTADQRPLPKAMSKWSSFGWCASEIDGHCDVALDEWIARTVTCQDKPSVAIAYTKKGCGVPLFEHSPERYHCATLSAEEYQVVREGLLSG